MSKLTKGLKETAEWLTKTNRFSMAHEIETAIELIEKLEKPDIYWCKDNPEDGMECAEELVSQFIDEDSVGQIIELEVASRLPNIKVKILPDNEHGGVELEYL